MCGLPALLLSQWLTKSEGTSLDTQLHTGFVSEGLSPPHRFGGSPMCMAEKLKCV